MKKIITVFTILFISLTSLAQNGINYKAVIKDDLGNVVANDIIVVQFTILDGVTDVYQENHTPNTDENGIVIINIGEGTPILGTFSEIDWSSNNHFLNVQINTGSGLQDMGTTAFKTVPYALMAQDVENKTWSTNGAKIYYDTDNVGIGLSNPFNPFSVLQQTGTANTVRVETQEHPAGKDLLELVVPSGSTSESQFIEMQNGFTIVAAVNSDGSAKFKSVQFEDNTVQNTAAIGPIAFGSISSSGIINSGSGGYSVEWDAVSNRYEITITGESYLYTTYTSIVTPASSTVRAVRTSSVNGKLLVYLYNSTGSLIQGNFHFVTYK